LSAYQAAHYISISSRCSVFSSIFFFTDTAPTEIYTLSLHDALPISLHRTLGAAAQGSDLRKSQPVQGIEQEPAALCLGAGIQDRSEEHTSELQSRFDLVCRLLLEKKKNKKNHY